MKTRRSFLKTLGAGTAFTTLGFSSIIPNVSENSQKPLRIGIIGAENSHTIGYGKMFNVEKKFPGVEVKYVWGETEELARKAVEKGQIPNMVKDPLEMLGKIDALIVDHRHPKYHLQAATPFVKAGIPTFIDKPFCYRLEEGKEFLSMARSVGTPVTSYSGEAHSEKTFDIMEQVKSMGEISHVVFGGPVDLESPYGGVFFYGIHLVQPLMYIFGEDIRKVRVTRSGKNATGSMVFGNGMLATLIFKNLSYSWCRFAETKNGTVELKSEVKESGPEKAYTDMVEMFRTGKEPRTHENILKCVAVLQALEQSGQHENWVEVEGV